MLRKSHHYVPQFYLRQFSKNGKDIIMFNLDRKLCKLVPIKGQCSERYFYSTEPELEDAFSKLESKVAAILRKIVKEQSLDNLTLDEYVHLLSFILFQRGRTKYMDEKQTEMIDYFFENMLKPMFLSSDEAKKSGLTAESIKDIKMVHSNPVLLPLLGHLDSAPLIADLSMSLLRNTSSMDFITSDNPVIFFNTFFNKEKNLGTDGFQSRGLQIFYPINSRFMLMFFDKAYYEIIADDKMTTKVFDPKDIRRINGLQIINCNKNVYFENPSLYQIINQQLKETGYKRVKHKASFRVYVPVDSRAPPREIHGVSSSKYTYKMGLKFMKIKKDANPEVGVRDKHLIEFHKKFIEAKEKRKIKTQEEMSKFVDDYFKIKINSNKYIS